MKKLYIALLTLALALVMIIPVATPAAANACNVKPAKPVPLSWVSWVTNQKMNLPDWPYTTSGFGKVTKLSDGTTVGHWQSLDFEDTGNGIQKLNHTCDSFTSSDFHGNTAEFYCPSYCKETGQTIRLHWKLIDNGEPGRYKDQIMVWAWLPDCGFPVDDWWPIIGPQDMSDPAWGVPVKITAGNIEVHVGRQK